MTSLSYSRPFDAFDGPNSLAKLLQGDYHTGSSGTVQVQSGSFNLIIQGEGMTFDGAGVPKSGVITEIAVYDTAFQPVAAVRSFEIKAADLNKALDGGGLKQLVSKLFGGDDTFLGSSGAESFDGLGGDDVFNGSDGADAYDGGKGFDTVSFASYGGTKGFVVDLLKPNNSDGYAKGDEYSSIEKVEGTNFDDRLVAGKKGVELSGGGGDDTMVGGAGKDVFTFNGNYAPGVDEIENFQAGRDKVVLSTLGYEAFDGMGPKLAKSSFVLGTAAKTDDQHLIYDKKTGSLFYDEDGSDDFYDQVKIAQFDEGLALKHSDFRLFDPFSS
jgi:Ca2+-binding RTX toxin-like protein